MTNTQAYNAASVAAILPAQSAKKTAPVAPWIGEGGFVPIPREFYLFALPQLSKGAAQQFEYHCASAITKGERAGLSYCYRETMASKRGKSLSSVDRANAELEARGMIKDTGRRYKHGGAVVFQILPPSQWLFDQPKNALPTAQKCAVKDAKTRPITREQREVRTKKQQTPLRAEVVADSISSNQSVPAPSTSALIARVVDEAKLSAAAAAKLIEEYGLEKVALQLNWLPARNPKSAPATFRASLTNNWDAPHRMPRPEVAREAIKREPVRANAGAYDEHRPSAPLKRQEPPKTSPRKEVEVTPPCVAMRDEAMARRDTAYEAVPEAVRPDAACDAVFKALPNDVQDYVTEEALKRAPGDGCAARSERLEAKRAFVWTHCRAQVELLGVQKREVMQ